MKIILREHVDHLGQRGDIVNVAPGYARNFLLPKGLAYEATSGNLKQMQDQRKTWAAKEAHEVAEAEALAARIRDLKLETVRKAGESGTLYGSVTNSEIAELMAEQGVVVERRKISLGSPIKTVGPHDLSIRLHPKVIVEFSVRVLGEDGQGAEVIEPVAEVAEPVVEEAAAAESAAPEADAAGEATEETP